MLGQLREERHIRLHIGLIITPLIVGGVIAGLLFLDYRAPLQDAVTHDSSSELASEEKQSLDTTLIIGDPKAKATMVGYADFKCPSCAQYNQGAGQKIRDNYIDTGLAKIIFRPYPVYSQDGAQALMGSYCANEQGKFTQYHDHLFNYMWDTYYQDGKYHMAIEETYTKSVMDSLLESAGIDPVEYWTCHDSKKYEKAYYDDIYKAAPDDIQGTPSFIINGQKITGPQPYEVFKALLDIQLR